MKPVHYSICVTIALLPLFYYVTWRVLSGPFSVEMQSMVIGAIVGSGLTAVTSFWLGSSASSQRKDEARDMTPPAAARSAEEKPRSAVDQEEAGV